MIAAISVTLVVLLAFNRTVASWWRALCFFSHEKRTRGTMAHRSMTPTALAVLLGCTMPVLAGQKMVVELQSLSHCPFCRQVAPTVEKLNAEGFAIQQIDVDAQAVSISWPGHSTAQQSGQTWVNAFGAKTIPCFVVIDTATMKHEIREGAATEQQLRAFFKKTGVVPQPKRER